jgi:GNAT superfamily N-acetyltransferase
MKGMILYVRPTEPGDDDALELLHDGDACTAPEGFVGKLAGEAVAHAGLRLQGPTARIECLVVASVWRRKGVARQLLAEVAGLVAPATLAAASDCPLREFFLAAGFEEQDGMLQRPSM